jgi:hypothetical protein
MALHDYIISNATFPSTRSDLNNALSAIVSNNSYATTPTTTYAYMWWYDITSTTLKFRNADNDAWISFATFDMTGDTVNFLDSTVVYDIVGDTTPQLGGQLDVNGNAIGDGSLELLKFIETASAVNELTITNNTTTNAPILSATGDDTNIDLAITPKGSGNIVLDGIKFPNADGTTDQILTTNGSGVLSFVDLSAGLAWSGTVITGSTLSAAVNVGYWINTTSNTCTITLPSSATAGDEIKFADYARTWGTNKIVINSNGLNYQGEADTYTVEYDTDGQSLNIVYSDATKGWLPFLDKEVANVPVAPPTQKAIFGFGDDGSVSSLTNLVSSSGVVASDVTGVGTARKSLAASSYGGDKAIFGYGDDGSVTNLSNLVSNSGVVAADVTGVGTARSALAAASYGGDKAIFGYGTAGGQVSLTNLVNSSGVVAADVTGVGTARNLLAAASYGTDKAIFGYGSSTGDTNQSLTNLVSNLGVVSADVTGVGTIRVMLAAASYGTDKAIFAYGYGSGADANVSMSNLVSNTGIVAADVTGVGSARRDLAAASYGGDKAIFGYGIVSSVSSLTNLVSSSGVIAADVTGVGTARRAPAASGFSYSA